MWKTFTSGAAVAASLAAAVGLLLAGCAGSPGPASVTPAEVRSGAVSPSPDVRGRNAEAFERALTLLRDQRLTQAEALLRSITEDQPELAGPWVNLAHVYLRQERDDEALSALEQAVLANPSNCAARNELGVVLRRRGEFAAAEAHYLACLEGDPGFQAAHLNLGILYELYLGRLEDALAAYRRYQHLCDEPDRRVDVWVMDLQRRLGT